MTSLDYLLNSFGIENILTPGISIGEFLGMTVIGFIGVIIALVGVRCVMEFIKILTDWSRFR